MFGFPLGMEYFNKKSFIHKYKEQKLCYFLEDEWDDII